MINTQLFEVLERMERYDRIRKYVRGNAHFFPTTINNCIVNAMRRDLQHLDESLPVWLEQEYFQDLLKGA